MDGAECNAIADFRFEWPGCLHSLHARHALVGLRPVGFLRTRHVFI